MSQPIICTQCGGGFEAKTITLQRPWGEELYEFENVPAFVCAQCGEIWIGAEAAQLDHFRTKCRPPNHSLWSRLGIGVICQQPHSEP
jgi:YgiT-type zinc finger domain-containing protein